jgi:LysR family transcriptional regulator, glycine cleavage system transcriptional activator
MTSTPSIQTLRAFEAAGRHQSYTLAADELNLTHGAISHRIRDLETRLRVNLFERSGHKMIPTPEAHRLLVQVRQILTMLDAAFPQTKSRSAQLSGKTTLVLSVLPALANRWLLPRLAAFQATHPDIELDLRVSSDLIDFASSGVDVAIRYGPGDWPDVRFTKLSDEHLFPVCVPAIQDALNIQTPDDLARAPLLRSSWQPWSPWFRSAGLDMKEPASGPAFSDVGMMLQAAASGQGVALARARLVENDIAEGRLVRLFSNSVEDVYAYYFVEPKRPKHTDAIQLLRHWMIEAFEPALKAIIAVMGNVPRSS